MLSVWLQFKRWLRTLLIALSTEQPVDWTKEASKLGTIIQEVDKSSTEPRRRLIDRIGKRFVRK